MIVAHWILGPQIVGFVMLLMGCITKLYPPKHINGLYGFRTGSSTKNQETWDEAQLYSARLAIKMGLIAVLIGLAMAAVIPVKYELVMVVATTFTGIGFPVTMIALTEKHLDKTFDTQ
jgi:uncharacterized membrane protein